METPREQTLKLENQDNLSSNIKSATSLEGPSGRRLSPVTVMVTPVTTPPRPGWDASPYCSNILSNNKDMNNTVFTLGRNIIVTTSFGIIYLSTGISRFLQRNNKFFFTGIMEKMKISGRNNGIINTRLFLFTPGC